MKHTWRLSIKKSGCPTFKFQFVILGNQFHTKPDIPNGDTSCKKIILTKLRQKVSIITTLS